jgi:GWxTD domain-containing protein
MVQCLKNNSKIKLLYRYCGWKQVLHKFAFFERLSGVTQASALFPLPEAFNVSYMKKYITLVFLFLSIAVYAQPLRDINYVYLYTPDEAFRFNLKPVLGERSFIILYTLQVKDTSGLMNDYSIQWEGRGLLSEKEGKDLSLDHHVTTRNRSGLEGRAAISMEDAPKYIVARVIKNSANRAWLFYAPLEANYPVNNFLTRNGSLVWDPFIHTNEKVKLAIDSGEWIVSYYDDYFPPAAPAFSEAQARVSRGMQIDSSFRVPGGEEINFSKKGLYLIQKDTNSLQGLAFRAEEDYPQYTKLLNLPGPFIYISTKQEYDRLQLAKDNKKAFDRAILNIATDTERARKLMRNYFRRVELANQYFTSYKEGWKTDRGMIYIIFGIPNEVFKFNDREVWNYENDHFKGRFNFSRSSSIFDPDNYVLIRDEKFKDDWYEVIDLWRNARF